MDPGSVARFRCRCGAHADAGTLTDPQLVGSVGPGWEYYLERLAAVVAGGDADACDFDEFYPALEPHYRRAAGLP